MTDFVLLEVGKPYPFPCREGITAEFIRNDNNLLQIAIPGITTEELKAYKKGKVKAGLLYENGVILLFFKFGDAPWMDSPLNTTIIPSAELTIPELDSKSSRLMVELHVIDTATGLLKVIRAFSLSPKLSELLSATAKKQRNEGRGDFDQQLNVLYQSPTNVLINRAILTPCG